MKQRLAFKIWSALTGATPKSSENVILANSNQKANSSLLCILIQLAEFSKALKADTIISHYN